MSARKTSDDLLPAKMQLLDRPSQPMVMLMLTKLFSTRLIISINYDPMLKLPFYCHVISPQLRLSDWQLLSAHYLSKTRSSERIEGVQVYSSIALLGIMECEDYEHKEKVAA